jgi:hypothetical protein
MNDSGERSELTLQSKAKQSKERTNEKFEKLGFTNIYFTRIGHKKMKLFISPL